MVDYQLNNFWFCRFAILIPTDPNTHLPNNYYYKIQARKNIFKPTETIAENIQDILYKL